MWSAGTFYARVQPYFGVFHQRKILLGPENAIITFATLRFPDGEVDLKYNVGTRSNRVDKAHWPDDLMAEVIS
jgi:hypothetical protein